MQGETPWAVKANRRALIAGVASVAAGSAAWLLGGNAVIGSAGALFGALGVMMAPDPFGDKAGGVSARHLWTGFAADCVGMLVSLLALRFGA